MNKQIKSIVGLGAVLAVLGSGLAILKFTGSDKDDTSSSSSVEAPTEAAAEGAGIILVEDSSAPPVSLAEAPKEGEHTHYAEGKIKELRVKNKDGEFTVIPAETDSEGGVKYTIKGYEDVAMDKNMVGTLVNNVVGITSEAVIEEHCKDFAKFGLEDPETTGELVYESGNVRKFYVGVDNPAVENAVYFRVDGSDSVYTVRRSALANYSYSPDYFVSRILVEKPEEDPVVRKLTIERDDIDYNFVIKYGEYADDAKAGGGSATHVLAEPTSAYLDVETSVEATNGLFGFRAADVYAAHCTEEDIKNAGLDDPFCRVTVEADGDINLVLLVSEAYTGEDNVKMRRIMLEGGNVIYTAEDEKVLWANVTPIQISSRLVVANKVWNIDKISFNAGDKKNSFAIDLKDDTMDRSKATTEDFNVTRNGEAFNAERYRQLYAFLVQSCAEEYALKESVPAGEPMVSVSYNDCYINESHTVEFYDYSAMTSLIVFDGKPKFFCAKSYAQTLADNVGRLDTGEEYVTTWK